MGLSQNDAKEQITSLQVAADLVSAIKALSANPDFAQLSKDAYAIPEKDQAKAEEARTGIAEYNAVIAEQKKLALELQSEQDDIDKRAKEIQAALDMVTERSNAVGNRERAADEREKSLTQRTVALDAREKALKDGQAKLQNEIIAFNDEKQRVADKENDLDAKADKLKALIG